MRLTGLVVATVISSLACRAPASEPPPAPLPPGAVEICAPCVGSLSGMSVGVADIYPRSVDGGAPVESAMLSLWSGPDSGPVNHVVVVVGQVVTLSNDAYRVTRITERPRDA